LYREQVSRRSCALLVGLAACGRIGFEIEAGGTAHCDDLIRNGDETGIDCGGSCALACADASCNVNEDCVTHSCVAGQCALATGPPTWVPGPGLTTARVYVQCATRAGVIYAIGGTTDLVPNGSLASVELLAPGASAWAAGPSLMTARNSHAVAATLDGTIYAFAGVTIGGTVLASLEGYSGSWATFAPEMVRSAIAAAGGLDGRLYVVDNGAMAVYTPSIDSWAAQPPAPAQCDDDAVARGPDGRIYSICGDSHVGTGGSSGAVDAWDPLMNVWTSVASMSTVRDYPAATTAPDGRIYVIGGAPAGAPAVEAYSVATDRWTPVTRLATPRFGAGVAIGGDGRIYVVGGADDGSFVIPSVEIYGPAVSLVPAVGPAGTQVRVSGTNFAASARFGVTVDGAPVASDVTDATGVAGVFFVVPALASGAHTVTVVDVRSQYPVSATFQIP
jgi:hypothetical protein